MLWAEKGYKRQMSNPYLECITPDTVKPIHFIHAQLKAWVFILKFDGSTLAHAPTSTLQWAIKEVTYPADGVAPLLHCRSLIVMQLFECYLCDFMQDRHKAGHWHSVHAKDIRSKYLKSTAWSYDRSHGWANSFHPEATLSQQLSSACSGCLGKLLT